MATAADVGQCSNEDGVLDYPVNLSISLAGGGENNGDSGSSGERSWSSPDGKDPKSSQLEFVCCGGSE